MHRMALNIDIVSYIRNLIGGKEPDPARVVVLAELGGAESIVCYLRDDLKTTNERDVSVCRELVRSHLNVRTNLTEENIRKLIRLKPDMVTFVSPGDISAVEPVPVNPEMYEAQLANFIAELRTNNILASILVEPDISRIKAAGKLEFDYVEISASGLEHAQDMNEELDLLENIAGLTIGANKLGMGVNISGGIGFDNMKEIASIEYIEDIVVGKPVLTRALAIGFEQAVRDIVTLI